MERSVLLKAVVKKYDETFKRHAVEMVLHGGKSVKQAAEELGVSQYSIYEWKKKFFPQAALPGLADGNKSSSAGLTQDVEALQKLVDLSSQRHSRSALSYFISPFVK